MRPAAAAPLLLSSLLPLALAAHACGGSSQGPFFGDERYLKLGVQPAAEADAVIAQHEQAGRTLSARIDGVRFTALEFEKDNQGAAIRVITPRGIELALDAGAPEPFAEPVHYRLSRKHSGDDHVAVREIGVEGSCYRLYAISTDGFVDGQPAVDSHPLQGRICGAEPADAGVDASTIITPDSLPPAAPITPAAPTHGKEEAQEEGDAHRGAAGVPQPQGAP